MAQVDRERFGPFVAELRKEKGMTQKELAQRINVSDKAVSKWERCAGLPDISLLLPLAEALGVTVTELLESRRLERSEPVSADRAEELVKKVLSLSGEGTPRGGPDRKKWGVRYALCLLAALAEEAALIYGIYHDAAHWDVYYPAALLTGLSAGFGLYFCLFAKTRLPWYHDVGNIGMYCDGPLRVNMPGVRFTNRNWPHILHWLRIWCLTAMALSGAVCFLAKGLFGPGPLAAWLPMTSLAGLFAAVYVPGKRYE